MVVWLSLLLAVVGGCRGAPVTKISIVHGNVLIMKAGTDTWIEAKPGMSVEPGDTIKAGDGARAEITFFEGSIIELEAGTTLSVAELNRTATGSTNIRLKQELGKTLSRVEKLTDPASRYEIETPAAVAIVRGTIMGVTVFEDGVTWVDNLKGSVVARVQDREFPVPVGHRLSIVPGQLPGSPFAIISETQPPRREIPPTPAEEELPPTFAAKPYKPGIALSAQANPASVHDYDVVIYTYEVTNTGNTALANVLVNDDKTGEATYQSGDLNGNRRLDIDETWIFTTSYEISDEDESLFTNAATASALGVVGPGMFAASPKKVTAQASTTISILRPAITLTKTANTDEAQLGDEISYTYVVTNIGNTWLSNVVVNDDKAGEAIYQSGDTDNDGRLDVNETWTLTASYTVTEEDTNPLVNVATASGIDSLGKQVTAQANASVTVLAYGIRIQLSWNAETDLDAHFIRPGGGMWNEPDDCYFRNKNPDWGLPGIAKDNPMLDIDDTDGYGPEYIYLKRPYEEGVYQFKVHCWNDYGLGASTATVIIWINDVKVAEYTNVLSYDQVWDCALIEWPSGIVTPGSSAESHSIPKEPTK